jgi:hypothetical protein
VSSLKTKGEEWKDRIFKMILFFAILGAVALGVGGWFLSRTLNEALAPSFSTQTTTTTSTDVTTSGGTTNSGSSSSGTSTTP